MDFSGKLLADAEIASTRAAWREAGKKVVFTNGCFDILHLGHVRYLSYARSLGDLLVVGVNSDASVRRNKGPLRPIVGQEDRAALLLALRCVDYVVFFEEDTPYNLITQVKPDILVKGGDYAIEQIAGGDFVRERGGQVLTIPLVPGYSTTSILEHDNQ